MLAHPQIQHASVVGTSDRFGNELACLFIMLHEAAPDTVNDDPVVLEKSVRDWVQQTLGPDYCPRIIKVVDEVKLSVNGKIDKKQMLAAYS